MSFDRIIEFCMADLDNAQDTQVRSTPPKTMGKYLLLRNDIFKEFGWRYLVLLKADKNINLLDLIQDERNNAIFVPWRQGSL